MPTLPPTPLLLKLPLIRSLLMPLPLMLPLPLLCALPSSLVTHTGTLPPLPTDGLAPMNPPAQRRTPLMLIWLTPSPSPLPESVRSKLSKLSPLLQLTPLPLPPPLLLLLSLPLRPFVVPTTITTLLAQAISCQVRSSESSTRLCALNGTPLTSPPLLSSSHPGNTSPSAEPAA